MRQLAFSDTHAMHADADSDSETNTLPLYKYLVVQDHGSVRKTNGAVASLPGDLEKVLRELESLRVPVGDLYHRWKELRAIA